MSNETHLEAWQQSKRLNSFKFDETIIPLNVRLAIVISKLNAKLVIYDLIANALSWNNSVLLIQRENGPRYVNLPLG